MNDSNNTSCEDYENDKHGYMMIQGFLELLFYIFLFWGLADNRMFVVLMFIVLIMLFYNLYEWKKQRNKKQKDHS